MNPLFKMFGNNNMQNMISQFKQFRQTFSGDPQQQVQQLLNSGRISQAQYNQAVQQANAFYKMLGGN